MSDVANRYAPLYQVSINLLQVEIMANEKLGGKRCMTRLDDDTHKSVGRLRKKLALGESQVIAILVREALAAREAKAKASA